MSTFDPYAILGLDKNCTESDIKKAYKKKSVKLHPDRNKEPDAQEKFQELGKAKDMLMDLQDPHLREAYEFGGWDMVDRVKHRSVEKHAKVCPPFGINLPVTLKQVVMRKKLKIKSDIPILDANGNKTGTKPFEIELEMDPDALGRKQVVKHQGIDRPDYVTGDIVIELDIDWSKEPTKFDISNRDLIYEHKIKPWEAFGAFNFCIVHPDGKSYRVTDYFDHPDEQGNQIYIYKGAGLTTNDSLMIIVSVDATEYRKLRKTNDLLKKLEYYCNNKPESVAKNEVDVAKTAMTLEQYKIEQDRKEQERMRMHFAAMGAQAPDKVVIGPGDCNQQ